MIKVNENVFCLFKMANSFADSDEANLCQEIQYRFLSFLLFMSYKTIFPSLFDPLILCFSMMKNSAYLSI